MAHTSTGIWMRGVVRVIAVSAVVLALALTGASTTYGANPAPVQTYYVTLPEGDALTVFDAINSDASTPIVTYVSIAIGANGTLVYYDQWENGYVSDLANPTLAEVYSSPGNLGGVQIWGDGNTANGSAPGFPGDVLNAGNVIVLNNNVVVPNSSGTIKWDARDKIGASKSIAMAHAAWPLSTNALLAFAHEMYSTAEWGTAYESPVGTNTASAGSMFQYAALSVMGSQTGTVVEIDKDANGTYETTVTLNEGGSTLATDISQGARVRTTNAAKPIQVVLLTGDIGSNYEARDMSLLPVSAFGTSYWSPVGVDSDNSGPTRLYLYNPSTNGSVYVTCELRGVVAKTILGPILARGLVTIDLTNNQGAHCYASNSSGTATGQPISAIGTVDENGQNFDWSWTLYPDDFLSTAALVGLGLGHDPNFTTTQNGSPLWVTAACPAGTGSTFVYVDWNNDSTPDKVDLNGDNDVLDTNVDGLNETTSNTGLPVARLQSVVLRDPSDQNQTGARVWSRNASGNPATPGCNLAVAWGEDPRVADVATPGLDVGTSVPPLRLIEGSKSLVVKSDADYDGLPSPGDTATYNITVKNTGSALVPNVYVYDTVPANTTYVNGTTQKDVGSGWQAILDDASPTAFPLDVAGGVLLGNLSAGATFYVRFDVVLGVGEYEELLNCDTALTSAGTVQSCATNFVATRDWGDLPDSYATTRSQNGPRHSPSDLKLGALADRELDGQPAAGANGDDNNGLDDEDGVVLAGNATTWNGGTGSFTVTVAGGTGCLNAWMDFTNDEGLHSGPGYVDGNFTNAGGYDTYSTFSEQIIANALVSTGLHNMTFAVPPGLAGSGVNSYYFRFRLSPPEVSGACAPVAPTGLIAGGEVEDYQFSFAAPAQITIVKVALPPSARVAFPFQTSGPGLTPFELIDNTPGITSTLTNSKVFGPLYTFEDRTVSEPVDQMPTDWELVGLAIVETGGIANSTSFTATATATIHLEPGEHVVITFTNQSLVPQAVTLDEFSATNRGGWVMLSWTTASEINNQGFRLYRSNQAEGPWALISPALIPSPTPGLPGGHEYSFEDHGLSVDGMYYYRLDSVDMNGAANSEGIRSVFVAANIRTFFLPFVRR